MVTGLKETPQRFQKERIESGQLDNTAKGVQVTALRTQAGHILAVTHWRSHTGRSHTGSSCHFESPRHRLGYPYRHVSLARACSFLDGGLGFCSGRFHCITAILHWSVLQRLSRSRRVFPYGFISVASSKTAGARFKGPVRWPSLTPLAGVPLFRLKDGVFEYA